MSERWLSIVEYARERNVSDMTIRRRIKAGKLKAVMRDGKYYIDGSSGVSSAPTTTPAPVTPKVQPAARENYHLNTSDLGPSASTMTPSRVPATKFVPEKMADQLSRSENVTVGAADLIRYCESSLKKFQDLERKQVERFKAKLETLEAKLETRDKEITQLNQNIEDLKMLVKMMQKDRSV